MEEFILKLKAFFMGAGEKALVIAIVLIVGILLIKLILKVIRTSLAKSKLEKTVSKFLLQIINFVLKLLLVYVIWDIMEIPSTLFVAIASVAGVAISLSIQGILSNFASGVLQISAKRFKEGDYIKIGGVEGTVTAIDITSITLTTPDNKKIYVPNSNATVNELTNFSANPTRRIEILVGVAYGTDIEQVKAIAEGIFKSDSRILTDPAPTCRLKEFGNSSLNLVIRCHTKTEDFWNVTFDINEKLYSEFAQYKIEIPFNQLDVHIKDSDKKN